MEVRRCFGGGKIQAEEKGGDMGQMVVKKGRTGRRELKKNVKGKHKT